MRGRAIVKHEERAPREASARGTPKATPPRHLHTGDVRCSCSRVRRGFGAPVVITIITKWFTMLLLSKLRSRTEVCQDLPRCRSSDQHNAVSYREAESLGCAGVLLVLISFSYLYRSLVFFFFFICRCSVFIPFSCKSSIFIL